MQLILGQYNGDFDKDIQPFRLAGVVRASNRELEDNLQIGNDDYSNSSLSRGNRYTFFDEIARMKVELRAPSDVVETTCKALKKEKSYAQMANWLICSR